jgi:IclR family acetate operon transcriptional repressor
MKNHDFDTRPTNGVRSVDKAIDIIEILSRERDGLALGQVAKRLGFNESTTHHLIATLKARGIVNQDRRTKVYRIGNRLVGLVNEFLAGMDLRLAGDGPLRELRDLSGETSYLTVLQNQETVSLLELTGHRPLQARRSRLFDQPDLHATASGKVLAAYLPQEAYESLLTTLPLKEFTPNTITDLEALRAERETIRHRQYALDREEHVAGVSCVAAPVFAGYGECVATASVSYPTADPERTEELVQLVTAAARKISANLGYEQAVSEAGRENVSATS